MRYRLEKKKGEITKSKEMQSAAEGGQSVTNNDHEAADEAPPDRLLVTFWPGPYSYAATTAEKGSRDFAFCEEGIQMAVAWLNQVWEQRKELFVRAWENW